MEIIYEMITKIENFSCFLEMLLCMYFCSAFIINEKRSEKRDNLINVFVAFALAFVAAGVYCNYGDAFTFTYQKKIFFFLLCVVIQWIFFHRKYFLAIVSTLIFSELTMVMELAIEIVLSSKELTSYQEQIVFLLCKIIVVTIGVVILHGLIPQTPIPTSYLLVVCLVTIISLLWNWTLMGTEGVIQLPKDFNSIIMRSMLIIFFLFQFLIVFFVFQIAKNHQQKQTTALIELNNKMLQKSLDETEQTFELWRQSVHDYKNHVIVLKKLADENRLDDIKAFLYEEDASISKQLFMIRTGNAVVDTLVNLKRSVAEKYHIAFGVHGTVPTKLIIEDMDLANILGNLLDNAIEASVKEEEAYIDLTIKQEKNFFIIDIHNKCTELLDAEIGKSSKENPQFHGIGLKSVKRAVKKYDGEIHMEKSAQEFIVTIMIQNKQEN